MLVIYPDRHMGVACDRCRCHLIWRQPGECVFTSGVRAERAAVSSGWLCRVVEVSLGRYFDDRILHLCSDCSAVPGPVVDGPRWS
jgi:hypothetical protein